MNPKRSNPVWIVGAMLVVLLAGSYLASYYALLERKWSISGEGFPEGNRIRRTARYGDRFPYDKQFFFPAHWLDRQLRPNYWRWHEADEPLTD